MTSKKVWITGANGQLAHSITEVAKREAPFLSFLASTRDTLRHDDPKALEQFIATHRPDFLVNCIAYTQVDIAETHYHEATLSNSTIPFHLANAVAKAGIPMIHIGTDHIFGGNGATRQYPYSEEDTPSPANAYALTKLLGEAALQLTTATYYTLRTSWLYAPAVWGHANFYSSIRAKATKGQPLSVVTDEVSAPTSALTLARVILQIIKDFGTPQALPTGTYHVTDMGEASRYDFAQAILALSPDTAHIEIKKIAQQHLALPAHRPQYSKLSTEHIQQYYPTLIRPWKEALQEIYQYDNQSR